MSQFEPAMEETEMQPEHTAVTVGEPEESSVPDGEPEHTSVPVGEPEESSVLDGEPEHTAVPVGEPEELSVPDGELEHKTVPVGEPEQKTVSVEEPQQIAAPISEPREITIPVSEEPEQPTGRTNVLMAVSQSTRGYPHPSQSSLHALEWTLQKLIHKNCRSNFKLLLVHVKVPDVDGIDEVDAVYATYDDVKHAKRKDLKKSFELLKVFVNKCKDAGVEAEGYVKIGDPKEVIVSEVLRVKPDLLILGSRGLGPLQRIFVGGVSSYCAKKVECPVLTIKRRPEDMPDDASED